MLKEMIYKRIYLLGMPSSGKSTFGKALSLALKWDFIDLDQLIEQQEGTRVSEVFEQKGEAYFRKAEENILQSALPIHTVIATGGGTPCFFNNMDFINKNGISLYLEVPVAVLAKRSLLQHGQRPLLNHVSSESEMTLLLKEKLAAREQFYQQAHLRLLPADQQAEKAIAEIKQYFPNFAV